MFEYVLEKEDLLRHYLFTSAKSQKYKTRKISGWILSTVAFLSLAFLLYNKQLQITSVLFLICAGACLLFYPAYLKGVYKKHFEKHLEEKFNMKMSITPKIEFKDGWIFVYEDATETKIKQTEIDKIFEIKENLFIKFYGGETLVIPKDMEEYENFVLAFKDAIKDLHKDWVKELDWRW